MDNVSQAIDRLAEAKNNAALGAEFAPDYVTLKGVKFFYKTFAHAWVIPAAISRNAKLSMFERGMLVLYILAQPPDLVRNTVMQQLDKGNIIDAAAAFFEKNNLTPEDLESLDAEKLMQHPYAKNESRTRAASSTTTGGVACSTE